MSNSDKKSTKSEFRKKEHRPWKTSLLEMTVQEASGSDDLDFNLDLDVSESTAIEPFYSEFNFIDEPAPSYSALEPLEISDITEDLKSEINQTQQQKKQLLSKLHDRSASSILLGGFFQPQQLGSQPDTPGAKRIHSLLSDLKSKEHRLSSLTRELEMSEAKERIEQAELTRKAETHSRLAAENRMRQAIEQAQVVAGQFRLAMEQANQAVIAHQEEEKLRIAAEDAIKEAKIRANNAELAAQNERMARMVAEEKMQEALAKAENTNLLQQQLLQTKEQLQKIELAKTTEENRRLDAERHYEEIQARFTKTENDYKQSANRIYELENASKDLQKNINDLHDNTHALQKTINELQQKLTETLAQRDKLKEIITAEQQLRRVSEQKMQEAQRQAEQSEKARQEEERQRKLIDERAKRAVEHASRTVMHILNAPDNNEYSMKIGTKPKIKVPAEAATTSETTYSFEEEDFKF